MAIRSLWRQLLYTELTTITLTGTVLDLGGYRSSLYHQYLQGKPTIKAANLDDGEDKDYTFDFEQPFPLPDSAFDGAVCINVLEHIFDYQNVLDESYRVLKPGAQIVLAVPFLIRYHPCPNDYWRYTESTLQRIFSTAGFSEIEIRPIGTGVCGAAYSMQHNLCRFAPIQWVGMRLAVLFDRGLSWLKPTSTLTKKYYPLGYVVIARK